MMGFLKIDVSIDLNVIVEKLQGAGWDVKVNMQNKDLPRIDPKIYKPFSAYIENSSWNPQEDFLHLSKSVSNRTFHMSISFTFLLIMLSSFYKISFLVDEIVNFLDGSRTNNIPKSKRFEVNFSGEQNVLR